jgi:hypothetical protein
MTEALSLHPAHTDNKIAMNLEKKKRKKKKKKKNKRR